MLKVRLLAHRVLHAVQGKPEKHKHMACRCRHLPSMRRACTMCKHAVWMRDRLSIGLQVHSRYQRLIRAGPAEPDGRGTGVTLLVPLPTMPKSTTAAAGAGPVDGPASALLLPCPNREGPKLPATCEKAACRTMTQICTHEGANANCEQPLCCKLLSKPPPALYISQDIRAKQWSGPCQL